MKIEIEKIGSDHKRPDIIQVNIDADVLEKLLDDTNFDSDSDEI